MKSHADPTADQAIAHVMKEKDRLPDNIRLAVQKFLAEYGYDLLNIKVKHK
jgi:hypothetical protein